MLTACKIVDQFPIGEGADFSAGSYEALRGELEFALDPDHPHNRPIVDLGLAPVEPDGRVRARANFHLMRPIDPARRSGTLLFNIANRGNINALGLNRVAAGNDPRSRAQLGDGFLMKRGFVIAACGWEADVAAGLHRLYLRPPRAAVSGTLRVEINDVRAVETLPLAHPAHLPYEPEDLAQPDAVMSVRDTPLDVRRPIPRERWRFVADPTGEGGPISHVQLEGGFQPGRLYDIVYRSAAPPIIGYGFAAVRDFASFLRYETTAVNPLSAGGTMPQHVLAYGASQSGRYLRHFLYEGFNQDEAGRRVFDGVFAHIAGAARGSFNHRFAQPSVFDRGHVGSGAPTERYPFSEAVAADPLTGLSTGMQDRLLAANMAPKTFYTNSSAEYWGVGAPLLHVDPLGTCDLEPPDNVRMFHFAGTQHVPGPFPPGPDGRMPAATEPAGFYPGTPVQVNGALRALLIALEAWVRDGTPPPASRVPHLAGGTLVNLEQARQQWPAIPGARFPAEMRRVLLYDYGPEWQRGVIAEPAVPGPSYAALVPAVNADGNERGSVQLPELQAPLATYTGWNYRHPDRGAPTALAAQIGSYFPFPVTRAAGQSAGDPRPSLEERYTGKDDYMARVQHACDTLVADRLLLAEDVPYITRLLETQWQEAMERG